MDEALRRRIVIFVGDITKLKLDALVTAANSALAGGGGVDGAIHDAAGPELVEASMALAPCPPGSAKITRAFALDAKYVIHAVGPIFKNLETDRPILAGAYHSALTLAEANNIGAIAFPCISTGVYGFPIEPACVTAINTVVEWLKKRELPRVVTFCCFSEADAALYREKLAQLDVD